MKGRINEHGELIRLCSVVESSKMEVPQHCPYTKFEQPCATNCPHLDTGDENIIRLTCGGTDVVFEKF